MPIESVKHIVDVFGEEKIVAGFALFTGQREFICGYRGTMVCVAVYELSETYILNIITLF